MSFLSRWPSLFSRVLFTVPKSNVLRTSNVFGHCNVMPERRIAISAAAKTLYVDTIPDYPEGFELPAEIYVSTGMVNGKVLEKPDFVKNEVPKPEVHPEIADLLYRSQIWVLDGKTHWPTVKKNKVKYLRIYYIARGYYWPKAYERDHAIIHKRPRYTEKRREARKKLIEEKMKEMPRLIAEYRERYRERRAKRREAKLKERLVVQDAKRRGINPRHAKAMAAFKMEEKKPKKVVTAKKGYRRKSKDD